MRITTVGGGPAGLYAAILLKRGDPTRHVTVYERNAPDDTFGWGVVFSAATLAELEDTDAISYDRLLRACARWDPVDVEHRGRVVRALGNRFAAISRKRLLQILQERCGELGVDLRFETEVDPTDLGGADLVLAADGINSRVRDQYADVFAPRRRVEGGRFIWLGTTRRYDAFTFVFAEHEAGVFQAHAYPYDTELATFIVECAPEVWQRAGLDTRAAGELAPGESDPHAIKFCEELFADHLGGHPLMGNYSRWLEWTTLSNRAWHHDRLALLGDAAHTAHFSIGSGTKLAMEDAIALARAVDTTTDVASALVAYEAERKPVVERMQEVARESLQWFSRTDRYVHLPTPQLAFGLLARSRLTYERIRQRDPTFVTAVDRWFAARSQPRGEPTAPTAAPPPAFAPARIAGLGLGNRMVLASEEVATGRDGQPDEATPTRLAALAAGGAGLALVERVAVTPEGRITPETPGCYTDEQEAAWRDARAAARERADDVAVGMQLVHAGARGATRPRREGVDVPLRDAWPLVAASSRPYTPRSPAPTPLDAEGRVRVREAFADAARRAAHAGFDLVEVHLGHGFLLGGYWSPLTGDADDWRDRLAYPGEVVAAVLEALDGAATLSVCWSASDLERGGTSPEDAVAGARTLADAGVGLFNVVAGQTTPRGAPGYEPHWGAGWSDLIRNEAGVPTIASGAIRDPLDASHVLAGGQADLCVLGRPHPAVPGWAHDL
ncbi:bifunctional salicylyl-CoA 5-hydroxylase/oxidoreductase [Egibacter rhizosphaerae]|uniref:Bifunctional salicylyl-CoA 5-hydroxylase/oxidoreductase n=1 Tax=Egibacter rhizosphaerae TaxID=1670831 RepID=A0A411YF41_9ACTN|nr:FAD-dependent monooxygenase [Egibacter rhizosphaerae]QBI19838.1 bifunctional salicylyl-CoA 5-hydroxylase/oxidoreductase [Egibacter rhizosphaerae]